MEDTITSASNPTIKLIRRLLTSAKVRREEALCVAEGIHLVTSFLTAGKQPTMYVVAASALVHSEIKECTERLSATSARRIVVADSLFESLASIHASVGILIVFIPDNLESKSFISDKTTILLDDIQDPGNLGTILRTAAAVGIESAYLSPGCASVWSPKALRAGMGGQFSMKLYENIHLAEYMHASTLPILATTLSSESVSLYTIDLHRPVVWLFGNEGTGVAPELLAIATEQISIPQKDTSVESLNVSAAAAVCLYEQYRQYTLSS